MIDYTKIQVGQKLKITGMGAPGFAKIGEVVTVESVGRNRLDAINARGERAYFALTCGAQRLEEIPQEDHPND